jgi:hypothetical protein
MMNNDHWVHEVNDFCEYAKKDPRVLIAGGGTALVLVVIGAPKMVALAAGALVAGVCYSNAKRRAQHSYA